MSKAEDMMDDYIRKEIEQRMENRRPDAKDVAAWDAEMREELGTKHDLLIHAMELICDD